jgi:hypothetical protein
MELVLSLILGAGINLYNDLATGGLDDRGIEVRSR